MTIRKPFVRNISEIPIEGAHGYSGRRQLLLSKADPVSTHFEAATKGFLDPGAVFDWHSHKDVDEMWIVLKGQGKIDYEDGTSFFYKEGDVVYNPANLSHRIEANGEVTSEYFFIRFDA